MSTSQPEKVDLPQTIDAPPIGRSGQTTAGPGTTVAWDEPAQAAVFPKLPGYEILGVLGRGGMGIVYKARHLELDRLTAIKMVLAGDQASEAALARFRTEAVAVARLSHPNIVQIHEIGECNGQVYFSLEFVDGGSLAQLLSGAPQPPRDAARFIEVLARAVHYAHEQGVVHRDLKPANILLQGATSPSSRTGASGTGISASAAKSESSYRSTSSASGVRESTSRFGVPKITDFGLAKRLGTDSGETRSGDVLGTPSYMAPEQAMGLVEQMGPAADIYALGAILYETLTGRPPFRGTTVLETLDMVRNDEPVAPRQLQPKVPKDLETICLACLRKAPQQRYKTALDLADDLARFLAGEPITARRTGPIERAYRWCRRNPALTALAVAGVLLCIALGAGGWYRERGRQIQLAADAKAKAAADLANTERYHGVVNRVRERAAAKSPGWTWTAIEDLRSAAAIPTSSRQPLELRALAARPLSRFDYRETGVVAEKVDPVKIAFSPDSKLLAVAERKHNISVSILLIDVATRKVVGRLPIAVAATNIERFLKKLASPQDGFTSLAFSPDGKWLVAGLRSGRIARWDLARPQQKEVLWQAHGTTEAVMALAFSPDSRWLVSGGDGKELKRWAVDNGWVPSVIRSDLGEFTDIAFAEEGRTLAVASQGSLRMCLLEEEELRPTFPENISAEFLAVGDGGRTVYCKHGDEVQAVDLYTGIAGQPLRPAAGEFQPSDEALSNALDLAGGGGWLASGWNDRRVRIWDVAAGRIVGTISVPESPFLVPRFSPDGRWLAISGDRQTHLYEVQLPVVCDSLAPQSQPVHAALISADGGSLWAAGDMLDGDRSRGATLVQHDLATGVGLSQSDVVPHSNQRVLFTPSLPALAAHPASGEVAAASSSVGLRLVPPANAARAGLGASARAVCPLWPEPVEFQEAALPLPPQHPGMEIRPDPLASDGRALRIEPAAEASEIRLDLPGELFASREVGWAAYISARVEARGRPGAFTYGLAFSGESPQVPCDLTSQPLGAYHLRLADIVDRNSSEPPKFCIAVAAKGDKPAALWIDRVFLVPFKPIDYYHRLEVLSHQEICFAPDGSRIWGVVDEELVTSWHYPSLAQAAGWQDKVVGTLVGQSPIEALAAGNRWVVAGRTSGYLYVLQASDAKQVKALSGPGGPIRCIAVLPGEAAALVGTATGKLRLIGLPEGETVADLEGHAESVESIAVSRAGDLLVTGSSDGAVRLWKVEGKSFVPLVTLPAHSPRVRQVRLDPAARTLAVLSEPERAVRVWRLDKLHARLTDLGIGW